MLEDMVLKEDREVPRDRGTLFETARAEWGGLQATTDRVTVTPVEALDLVRERRKSPVFRLSAQR
jgi:GMP synthase (glutamine-hydrolysing)